MNKITILDIGTDDFLLHPVVLSSEDEMILVDCGSINTYPLLEEAFTNKGLDINKLTRVLITNHEFNHIGNLHELKARLPNLIIYSHAIEKDYIEGKLLPTRLLQAKNLQPFLPTSRKQEGLLFIAMFDLLKPVTVNHTLKNGDILSFFENMEVISTPGYSKGHLSFYIPKTKTLIAGDVLDVLDGALRIVNPRDSDSTVDLFDSIRNLSTYDIDEVYCYHGGYYSGNVKESLLNIVLPKNDNI